MSLSFNVEDRFFYSTADCNLSIKITLFKESAIVSEVRELINFEIKV